MISLVFPLGTQRPVQVPRSNHPDSPSGLGWGLGRFPSMEVPHSWMVFVRETCHEIGWWLGLGPGLWRNGHLHIWLMFRLDLWKLTRGIHAFPRGRKPIPSWPRPKVEQVMRLDPGDRVNAFFKVNGGRPLGRRVIGEGGENGDLEWEDLMGIYVICICK